MSGPGDPCPAHVVESILFQYRRKVGNKRIAQDNGVSVSTVQYHVRKHLQAGEGKRSHFKRNVTSHQGRLGTAESAGKLFPYKAPPHKPPVTGSASGFIRPLDYKRLTGSRA